MNAQLSRSIVQWLYLPTVLCVAAVGIGLFGQRHVAWIPAAVLGVIGLTFAAERVLPFSTTWQRRDRAFGADARSAIVNESLSALGVLAVPALGGWFSIGLWPDEAPRAIRLLVALAVLDAGVTAAHWLSHRREILWRFHAVHHGAARLYGLNGLMKHPVHLIFETVVGITPLVVLGIDAATAGALAGLVAVQLVLQHANVDYRAGALARWFAWNAGHRLHHVADEVDGNVNFGLFTLVWDRMLGTYRAPDRNASTPTIGLASATMPSTYFAQLAMPWTGPDVADNLP